MTGGTMTFRARKASPQAYAALLLSLFVLLVAAALMAPAFGQVGIGGTIDLRESDIDMAKAAGAKLCENPDTAVGTVETWSNPKTGASGKATLTANFKTEGMQCRRIQHVIKVKSQGDPYVFTFDRCQTADGTWKTYP